VQKLVEEKAFINDIDTFELLAVRYYSEGLKFTLNKAHVQELVNRFKEFDIDILEIK